MFLAKVQKYRTSKLPVEEDENSVSETKSLNPQIPKSLVVNISGSQSDYYVAALSLGFQDFDNRLLSMNGKAFPRFFGLCQPPAPPCGVGRRDLSRLGRVFAGAKY